MVVEILLGILAFVLIIVGFIGVFLPILPGIPLAWLGLFIFAIGTGFDKISILATVLFFVWMVLTLLLDFLAPMIGAGKYKASKWGIIGTTVGLIVGLIWFGFWGVILGPFIGAFAGELLAMRPPKQALKSAFGAFIGFLAGTLFRVIYIFVLLGFFIFKLITG
ncbi:MAG: DUF456 domain-containing protein [Dehalococcoidales bacterium]|nr:DUF456 domain-containing protein [Dehalococcoidales bacterium]